MFDNPWGALPGADLVHKGVRDLRAGKVSTESLLVAIGEPELRWLGVAIPDTGPDLPEHALYAHLAAEDSDTAHARYNALLRRLISFERALACVTR